MALMVKFMIKKMYSCDAGSIQIQCGESYINFPNCYGDGCFKAYLFDSNDEFNKYKEEHYIYPDMQKDNYHYEGQHYFTGAKVLNYDCFEPGVDFIYSMCKEILFELNGKYNIWANYGKVYFVKVCAK